MRAAICSLLLLLGGCSTCGSLFSESGAVRPAAVFTAPVGKENLQEPAQPGDDTRLPVSGRLYWIEENGPALGAPVRLEVINLNAADSSLRVISSQSLTLPRKARAGVRFAFGLDADDIPADASLALEAKVGAEEGAMFRTLSPIPIGPAGAQGLRVRVAPALR